MDDNDFANMFKKAQEMINNNQVPDELRGLVNNMKNNNYSNGNAGNKTDNYSNTSNNYYNKYSITYSRNNNNVKNERNNTQNHNSYRTNPYQNTAHQSSSNSSSYQNNSNNSSNNNSYQNNNSNNGNMNFDMSKLSELLKNMQGGSQENKNSTQSDYPDIDMETMLKLQNIMSKLKSNNSNDDMSKLLLSLKPYLRNEKKEKVDEYIKLIKMGKMTQLFDSFGGDKK